tara:strand:- start:1777 stop:2394 length:618 start_codon:yes stop_codon:yes gene_type:complete
MTTKTSKTLITTFYSEWLIKGTIIQVRIKDEALLKTLEKKIKTNIDPKLSYKTNVYADMTHWDQFKQDEDFKKLLHRYLVLCGEANLYPEHYDKVNDTYHFLVQNAWGTLMKKNDRVKSHHHLGTDFASVLYFDSHASLNTDAGNFPTERGLIITLPSYCFHSVAKITKDITRCTLAWNWSFAKSWDKKNPNEEYLNYLVEGEDR